MTNATLDSPATTMVVSKKVSAPSLGRSNVFVLLLIGSIPHQYTGVMSGLQLEAVKSLAKRMKLDDMVTFTGRVDDHALFTALSTADVCVNPDRPNAMNDKSTMNKIMEYMAMGKPIVQFDLRGGRASADIASLYARDAADFGDKIIVLLDDPATRQAMGEFGRKRVAEVLAWPHEIPKLLAAYEAALA